MINRWLLATISIPLVGIIVYAILVLSDFIFAMCCESDDEED